MEKKKSKFGLLAASEKYQTECFMRCRIANGRDGFLPALMVAESGAVDEEAVVVVPD